jgi:ankyrin repeat protein
MVITLRIFDPDSVDADQIAAMLIAAHADTKLRDRYGKTAKEIADRTQVPISVRRQLSLRLMLPFHTLNGP